MVVRRSGLRAISIVSASVALLIISCLGTIAGGNETLQWELDEYDLVSETDTGWKGVGGRKTKERIFAEPGATTDDWTVTLHVTEWPIAVSLGGKMQWNAPSIMGALQRSLSDDGCVDPWNVIRSTSESLVYERTAVACPGYLHQHELGRILVGDWFMWWVSFRIRNTTLTEADRSALISKLEQARIGD